MRLSGNTVLITGGGTGIGRAMAEAFVDAGSDVVICGRREARLHEARARRPSLLIKACDIANAEERQALMKWVADTFPRFNVLVNNAGIQRDIAFGGGAAELEGGEDEIAVNLKAPIVLSALAAPLLAGRDNAAIINVSSGLGFIPAAKMPVYSATKAGIHAFTMALRFQLSRLGIQVFEVVPPSVDTELNPEGRARRGGFKPDLAPEPFVAAVMKGLESGTTEIGYGMTLGMLNASRAELQNGFVHMNSRM